MKNHTDKFELLNEEASGALGLSYDTLKEKYEAYPVCFMEYIEDGIREYVIEASYDDLATSIMLSFGVDNKCEKVMLFFDQPEDEDLFIAYLNKTSRYDFKRSKWIMKDCYLKIEPPVKSENTFHYCR